MGEAFPELEEARTLIQKVADLEGELLAARLDAAEIQHIVDEAAQALGLKRRIIQSAAQDEFTQPCWNPRWGYGRLQVQRLLEIEPVS